MVSAYYFLRVVTWIRCKLTVLTAVTMCALAVPRRLRHAHAMDTALQRSRPHARVGVYGTIWTAASVSTLASIPQIIRRRIIRDEAPPTMQARLSFSLAHVLGAHWGEKAGSAYTLKTCHLVYARATIFARSAHTVVTIFVAIVPNPTCFTFARICRTTVHAHTSVLTWDTGALVNIDFALRSSKTSITRTLAVELTFSVGTTHRALTMQTLKPSRTAAYVEAMPRLVQLGVGSTVAFLHVSPLVARASVQAWTTVTRVYVDTLRSTEAFMALADAGAATTAVRATVDALAGVAAHARAVEAASVRTAVHSGRVPARVRWRGALGAAEPASADTSAA
eukprot:COSAG01_NODE_16786_length_1204_cov_3.916742_1_plen_336_part_01